MSRSVDAKSTSQVRDLPYLYPYHGAHRHTSDLTSLIPTLIGLLTPTNSANEFDEDEFALASDALQEIMSKSALANGAGSKSLTEPLLLWCEQYGTIIVERTLKGVMQLSIELYLETDLHF